MGVKVTNNGYGTLSAGIASGDTTITLDGGQGARFPTLGAGDYFYGTLVDTSNNIEVVKVTARSTDSMTVVRGQDNTTARAYAIGDRFELRPTAALFDAIINEVAVDGITSNATGNAITIDSSNDVTIDNNLDVNALTTIHHDMGSTEPLSGLIVENTGNNYTGITLDADTQTHLRFRRGGNLRWQFRHASDDELRLYSWDKSDDIVHWNHNGSMKLPHQPAWSLRPSWANGASFSANHIINFTSTATRGFTQNVTVSSGRVTVPQTGRYFVASTWRQEDVQTDYQLSILVNGTDVGRSGIWYTSQRYENIHVMRILALNANDYVEIKLSGAGSSTSYTGYNDTLTFFEGFMLG